MDRPKVILIMVETIDGVIAHNSHEFVDWSSKEDKKHFRGSIKEIGCTIVGSSTFDTLEKPFRERKQIILTRTPEKYDGKFPDYDNLYFMNATEPEQVLEKVKELGFDRVALIGGSQINTFFAKKNLIDELWLTIEPIVFGKGLHLFTEELNLKMKLKELEKLNEDAILLKYENITE